MNELRPGLPELPPRMRGRPIDARGFPVPWFVAELEPGVFDFRVIRPGGIVAAYNRSICWLCGGPLGQFLTFVIGPMCAITRTTSEPPSHHDCATFAAKACPFLTTPAARRNERDYPEGALEAAGTHLKRNPGVTCLWTTKHFAPFRAGPGGGWLFTVDDPTTVEWYAEGRAATRAEVDASVAGGLPLLLAECGKDRDPKASTAALLEQLKFASMFFPPEDLRHG